MKNPKKAVSNRLISRIISVSSIFALLLLPRLAAAATALPASQYDGDAGRGLAIAGLAVGLLGVLAWVLSPYLGIILTIPLGLTGLLLSIFGLVKAKRRYRNKLVRALAIAGIVVGGLLTVGFGLVLALFSS